MSEEISTEDWLLDIGNDEYPGQGSNHLRPRVTALQTKRSVKDGLLFGPVNTLHTLHFVRERCF